MDEFRHATFVFLSSRTGPSMGRIERRLLKVMAALVEEGATVNLICPPDSPVVAPAREAGANVAPYKLVKANYVRTRSRLKKYLMRYRPVVAHSTGFEADVLLRMAAEDLQVKVVNSVHCAAWPRRRTSRSSATLRKRLDARTLPRVDVLAADCGWLADQMAEAGLEVGRVMLDPPSVDLACVRRDAEEPSGLPGGDHVWMGYAGRLERTRGLETIVEARAILAKTLPRLRVALAGDGPARASLMRAAKPSTAFWLPGKVPSVPAVLAALDVCCFPSISPGVPTSLLEAAALGRPIVAANVPGIADLYRDGEEVLLVPPGDAPALAAAVASLLADPERARRMGEDARLRTVDEYASPAGVRRYLDLYRSLMAD